MGVTNVDVLGVRTINTTAVVVNVTFDIEMYMIDTTAGNVVVNLPSLVGRPVNYTAMRDGSFYAPSFVFVRTTAGTNTITFTPSGANTINGGATALHGLVQWSSKTVMPMTSTTWAMTNSP